MGRAHIRRSNRKPDKARPQDSLAARLSHGRALRKRTPRSSQARFAPSHRGRDVVGMLEASNRGRVPSLIPIRYGRMLHSPFAFLRGAASIMAFDLARTPVSGILVQACGDAHVMNFGGFATPERNLLFDVNDFDESMRAPWEWDLKRLAASVTVAGRNLQLSKKQITSATGAAVAGYRERMSLSAPLRALELWYQRVDASEIAELHLKARGKKSSYAPPLPVTEHLFPKFTEAVGSARQIKEERPLIFRPRKGDRTITNVKRLLALYRASLPADRRLLLERFRLVDIAIKVVGVGSVGTRCAVALLMAGDNDPLFLQLKEARRSVFERYVGRSPYSNHGQRVVEGQRLMQAASDMFLGWSQDAALKVDFYVRQLRDCKTAPNIDTMDYPHLRDYAWHCGATLARAHAKVGDVAAISGYIGKSDALDAAIVGFASAYADQTEADFATLTAAAKAGRIAVEG